MAYDYEEWKRSALQPAPQTAASSRKLRDQYPDTWRFTSDLLRGRGGPRDFYHNLLEGFEGGQNLHDFLGYNAPFLVASLQDTPAFKTVTDFEALDRTPQAMAEARGQIAAGEQRGVAEGGRALRSAGLGRSGALAALQQRAAQESAGSYADVYGRLLQAQGINRGMLAGNALSAESGLLQQILGVTRLPPQEGGGPDWTNLALMGGQAIGGLAGSLARGGGNDVSTTSKLSNKEMAGGIAQDAGTWATAGSVFGPIGMGVGALAGGIKGWLSRRR